MRLSRVILLAMIFISLAGCGLKGPLYLPEHKKPAPPAPAPQAASANLPQPATMSSHGR
jgi:predicted small lipoprotein YifL